MSAFAKLYASRVSEGHGNVLEEKLVPKIDISVPINNPASVRRRIDAARDMNSARAAFNDTDISKKESFVSNYGAALGMLENVNAGFVDVYNRLQESDRGREQLAAEYEKQDKVVQQLQYDLEMSRRQCEHSEKEASEIADRLIAESARATNLEHKSGQIEQALHGAQDRIAELEAICKTLHDGIVTIFGVGSPTQKVLDELGRKHI